MRTVDEMKNESKNVRFLPFSALSAVNEKQESPLDETWKETSMRHMQFLGQLSLKERRPTKDSGDPRDGNPTGGLGTAPDSSHTEPWKGLGSPGTAMPQRSANHRNPPNPTVPAATFCF